MRFQLLGPLRFRGADSVWRPVPAAQQRVVLAVLLAQTGQAVSADRLIAEIWGERPPRTALRTLQGYVFRLRRMLGDPEDSLETRDGGYALRVDDDDVDALVFERLAAAAKAGPPREAESYLSRALALWRGPVFADVPSGSVMSAYAARLERSKLDVSEDWLEALLALDRPEVVAAEAQRLVTAHPLRERLHEQLVLSLYRCGRRAEALECYQQAREALISELGVEPGPRLRQLHHDVLNDEPHLAGDRPRTVTASVPAQLPPDIPGFIGRDVDLKYLDELLRANPAPVLVTVAGPPGVGKTALAVHWGHLVRHRFPDGQLYVNLRGYASSPALRPIETLARFLAALEVPAEQVPADVESAAAMYRSLLSDRRVLILLDNAHHPDQVRPLLPASPGCLVAVTSRDRLDGLVARDGASRLTLEALSPDDARTLLTGIVGTQRVAAEPDASAEVARLCDHLPLALRIAAANLAAYPTRSIVDYVRRLGSGDRLAALEVEGDEHSGVQAAFGTSYRALNDLARRLLRLLALPPGSDITAPTAAALAGIPDEEAGRLLDQLCGAHLVSEHAPGRYALHDLLRLYAAGQAAIEDSEPDRHAALDRWYGFHLHAVDAAAQRLYPQMLRLRDATVDGAGFGDDAQALAWLDAERANLVAAVVYAAEHGPHPAAWRLADALRGYLYLGVHTVDWRAVAGAGHTAAEASGDLDARVSAELNLAALALVQNRYEAAIVHNSRALEAARKAGWEAGESTALCNLGATYWAQGDARNAASHHAAALAIDRRIDRVAGQAANLGNLGPTYAALGQLELAAEHRTAAIALSRRIGSQRLEGVNLAGLAEIHHAQGRFEDAITAATEALEIFHAANQRQNEPYPMCTLAAVHRDSGRYDQAMEYARDALKLAQEGEDLFREAAAYITIGSVHTALGQSHQAVESYSRALDLAGDIGDRYLQTEAMIGLAKVLRAKDRAQRALEIARERGYRMLEGDALEALAGIVDDPVQVVTGRP